MDDLFVRLLPASAAQALTPLQVPLRLQARRAVAEDLQRYWPEFALGPARAPCLAMQGAHPRPGKPGLTFGPGLLRAPTRRARHGGSSAILAAWDGRRHHQGLGARLLAQAAAVLRQQPGAADQGPQAGPADQDRQAGAAVAAEIVAQRIGLRAAPPPAGPWRSVLVPSATEAADLTTLAGLLRSGPASQILVLAPGPALARPTLRQMALRAGCAVADAPCDPWAILDAAGVIHAPAEHPLALLALLAGRTVTPTGPALASIDPALVASAFLVRGARYIDPADGRALPCAAFLDRLVTWQRLQRRLPRVACFTGISFWKRQRLSEFLGVPARFAPDAARAVAAAASGGGAVAVWPSRAPRGLDALAAASGVPVFRIEDGFIRSRGLGADFIPPASVIMDGRGIYYDPRQPSDLEAILAGEPFPPALLARAARLIETLTARGISKYNLPGAVAPLAAPPGARRILVPGQVADDQSVLAGGTAVAPNLPLLQAVRARHPDAFIVFKPHPDVEAGHRRGAVPDAAALRHADQVVRGVGILELIASVDEVHTVTSLAGFEALVRGRAVTTYGRPFYAGWGLTTDIDPPPRRQRRLSLAELVAGTLILYPHYIDPLTGLPCGPEELIDRLDQPAAQGALVALRRLQGALRRRVAWGLQRLPRWMPRWMPRWPSRWLSLQWLPRWRPRPRRLACLKWFPRLQRRSQRTSA